MASRRATFFCIEQPGGRVLWEKRNFGEEWWIGIEAVSGSVLLLHRFATPDLPEHRGIIGVDTTTGKVLWSSEDLKFLSCGEGKVIAVRFARTGKQHVTVDLMTGAILHELGEDEASAAAAAGLSANIGSEIQFPRPYMPPEGGTPDADLAMRRIATEWGRMGRVEYIPGDGVVILSSREDTGDVLRILNRQDGEELYSDTAGPFFLQDDTLYYIKAHNRLIAVPLTVSHD